MRMRFGFVILAALALCHCTYSVHEVGFSNDVPVTQKKTARPIAAESSQFVILGFVGQTDYVNEAYRKLQSQCPQGPIAAITTKFYTDHGFLSWTNHVAMNGLCLKD